MSLSLLVSFLRSLSVIWNLRVICQLIVFLISFSYLILPRKRSVLGVRFLCLIISDVNEVTDRKLLERLSFDYRFALPLMEKARSWHCNWIFILFSHRFDVWMGLHDNIVSVRLFKGSSYDFLYTFQEEIYQQYLIHSSWTDSLLKIFLISENHYKTHFALHHSYFEKSRLIV